MALCFLAKMEAEDSMQPGLLHLSVKGSDCEDPSLTRRGDQGKSAALHFFDHGPSRAKPSPIR